MNVEINVTSGKASGCIIQPNEFKLVDNHLAGQVGDALVQLNQNKNAQGEIAMAQRSQASELIEQDKRIIRQRIGPIRD